VLDDPAAPVLLMPADAYTWPITHPVSYFKGAYGMVLLREQILGKQRFDWAFRKYIRDWAFKHPAPSDFFREMSSEGGEDLDWFWRGWYMNNWRFNLAVTKIDGDQVTLVNKGQLVLPATVEVKYTDGTTTRFRLPVETWESKSELVWPGEKPVASVKVDPDHVLPDDDRADNSLEAK
jgi:aminopeptidase N